MSLYGQEPEARLLNSFLARLEHRSVVDVGAERGALSEELLRGGATEIYAIEPEPRNAEALRDRFSDSRVRVLELAAGDSDGDLPLHLSISPSGDPITFGHTTLERPATDEIVWNETLLVSGRSLSSLVQAGELPARVGVVKIDTEGHDLAVAAGMGDLICDVVMVEHWVDLPKSLGVCPWSSDEMVELFRTRGFSHFALIVHQGEFAILQWDDARVSPGAMGNLVFIHDRVVDALLPDVLESASSLAEAAVELAVTRTSEAEERRVELERATLRASAAAAIQELAQERDVQAKAAEERLVTITKLQRELELQTSVTEDRLRSIDELTRAADVQAAAAVERLETIKELERDRDLHRQATEERRSELNAANVRFEKQIESAGAQIAQLEQERDLQAQAAAERLETIEALERDRDLHRQAAEERLSELDAVNASSEAQIAELANERDLQAQVAAERLSAIDAITDDWQKSVEDQRATELALRQTAADLRDEVTRLEQERDLQAQAAAERLETIEALERDRDLHRQAAEERLAALDELAQERDRQAIAAEQRLAAIEGLDRDRNAHSERGNDGWR